jgi:uncharacterized protein (TIGR02186 family)
MRAFPALALLLLCAGDARAEDNLVSGLSQDSIQITSSYNGTNMVVFGAVERPASASPDIIVVLRGPDTDMRIRQKSRIAGIWINSDRAILKGMPAYYFVASTRPLDRIASKGTLEQYDLGLAAVQPHAVIGPKNAEPFRRAALRYQQRNGLYTQLPGAVQFLSGTLFRVRLTMPASAPRGRYIAETYLLRDGRVIDIRSSELVIDQTGLERRVFDFSRNDPLAYGISIVLVSIAFGWLSSLAFRRMD